MLFMEVTIHFQVLLRISDTENLESISTQINDYLEVKEAIHYFGTQHYASNE